MITPFVGSVCLLRHPKESEAQWLTVWNEPHCRYDFIASEKLEGDSFRECIEREVGWVLDLRRGRDYIVSSQARLHLELSIDAVGLSHVIEFYVTDLYGAAGRAAVQCNSAARWLTGAEILDGESQEGLPVNPQHVNWIQQADVIPRHQL